MTDGELVRQVLAGHTAAREELARVWSPRVIAMCQARVGRSAAEDLAQDSLIKALRELPQLTQPDRFAGWLRSIAVRVCIDWLRHRRLTSRPKFTAASAWSDAARTDAAAGPSLEEREERESLWAAIEELPEDLKEVLLLFYCDNLNYDAIAQMLDVARSTVNSRLAKARELVRRRMTTEPERDRGLCERS
jgi:RNA polymerase sigma-70 factor (ECF subfamily)